MGKKLRGYKLYLRPASGVPNLCDLKLAVEGPCFILLPLDFTIDTIFYISKDFTFY